MSSQSPRAAFDLARAEARLRPASEGLTFRSVTDAVGWYFTARERLQAPHGMHPRVEYDTSGQAVILTVDGGRGGDLDEVLATVSTIGSALMHLREERGYEQAAEVYIRHVRDGRTVRALAEETGLAASTCSHLLGRAEGYLVGVLRWAGVLR